MPFALIVTWAILVTFYSAYLLSQKIFSVFSFTHPEDQITEAELSEAIANTVTAAVRFERSRYTNGSIADDEFYSVSSNAFFTKPGSLLKVQTDVDVTSYSLSSERSLSRIIFQSKTINDSIIPILHSSFGRLPLEFSRMDYQSWIECMILVNSMTMLLSRT